MQQAARPLPRAAGVHVPPATSEGPSGSPGTVALVTVRRVQGARVFVKQRVPSEPGGGGRPGRRGAGPGCGRRLRGRRPEAPRALAPADLLRPLLQMYRLTLRTSKETVSQRLCELLSEQF